MRTVVFRSLEIFFVTWLTKKFCTGVVWIRSHTDIIKAINTSNTVRDIFQNFLRLMKLDAKLNNTICRAN